MFPVFVLLFSVLAILFSVEPQTSCELAVNSCFVFCLGAPVMFSVLALLILLFLAAN